MANSRGHPVSKYFLSGRVPNRYLTEMLPLLWTVLVQHRFKLQIRFTFMIGVVTPVYTHKVIHSDSELGISPCYKLACLVWTSLIYRFRCNERYESGFIKLLFRLFHRKLWF